MVVYLTPTHFSSKHFYPTSQTSISFHHLILTSTSSTKHIKPPPPSPSSSNGGYLTTTIKAYIENTNPISSFANKVIGSLPVVGLIARIVNDEGGLGGDIIDFAEFRRRVGNKCTVMDSRAFFDFQLRRGRAGEPLYVLLCCWLAALGAGLLKSEEILEGVSRLSISNDIEFEEQSFIAKMTEARERRAKLKAQVPKIPMELRVEKALDAIYVCCFDNDPIEEEDERLLIIMLTAVFPTVERSEIEQMIKEKAKKVVEEGNDESPGKFKPLSKEAIQLQMKDLEFLKQNNTEILEKKTDT